MGHELIDFLARVVERTAERWPLADRDARTRGAGRLPRAPGPRAPRQSAHRRGLSRGRRSAYLGFLERHRGGALALADLGDAERRRRPRLPRPPPQRRPPALGPLALAGPVGDPRLPPLPRPPARRRLRRRSRWCAGRRSCRRRAAAGQRGPGAWACSTEAGDDPDREDWENAARRGGAGAALRLRPAHLRGAVAEARRRAARRVAAHPRQGLARPASCRCCRRCARRSTPISPRCRSRSHPDDAAVPRRARRAAAARAACRR